MIFFSFSSLSFTFYSFAGFVCWFFCTKCNNYIFVFAQIRIYPLKIHFVTISHSFVCWFFFVSSIGSLSGFYTHKFLVKKNVFYFKQLSSLISRFTFSRQLFNDSCDCKGNLVVCFLLFISCSLCVYAH